MSKRRIHPRTPPPAIFFHIFNPSDVTSRFSHFLYTQSNNCRYPPGFFSPKPVKLPRLENKDERNIQGDDSLSRAICEAASPNYPHCNRFLVEGFQLGAFTSANHQKIGVNLQPPFGLYTTLPTPIRSKIGFRLTCYSIPLSVHQK